MENRPTSLAPMRITEPAAVNGQRMATTASPTIPLEPARGAAEAEARPVSIPPAPSTRFRRLPLRANFAWTLAGNVTSAGCAWLIVVAIVKLGSMEMAGQYAFSQAVVVPILGFSMLQLRAICATDAGNEYQFGNYLGLRVITTLLAFATMAIVAFGTMSGATVQQLTLAVGLGAAVEAIADAIYGGLQQRERMDYVSLSMVCRSTVALAAAVGTLWTTKNIVWSLWAGALTKGFVLVALDIPLAMVVLGAASSWNSARNWCRQTISEARNVGRLAALTWYSLPLGLVMLLLTLQTSLPRYLIENWLDSKQLGVFSALSYAAISGNLVVSALAQAAAPRMAQHYVSRDARSYYILMAKLAALGATIGICGITLALAFGRPVLTLLYAADYATHNDIFVWLMVASGVGYVSTFFGWGMTAARQIRIQLPLFGAVVALMFAAGCVLVPRWGLTGAAVTVLVGALAQLTGTFLLVMRAIPGRGGAATGGDFAQAGAQS